MHVTWNSNHTVTFQIVRHYSYDSDNSNGSLHDNFTTLDSAALVSTRKQQFPLPDIYYNCTIPEHLEDLSLDDNKIIKYIVKCCSIVFAVVTPHSIRTSCRVYTYSNEPSVFGGEFFTNRSASTFRRRT